MFSGIKKLNPSWLLIAAFVASTAFALFLENNYSEKFRKNIAFQFRETLNEKERVARKEIKHLQKQSKEKSYSDLILLSGNHYSALEREKGISIFVFENDSILLWTSNTVPINNSFNFSDKEIIHLDNGWYYTVADNSGVARIVAFILIKSDFPHTNKYLVNKFQKEFQLPDDAIVSLENRPEASIILEKPGGVLGYISFSDKAKSETSNGAAFFYLISYLLLLLLFFRLLKPHAKRGTPILLFCFFAFCLRFLMIKFTFPTTLYNSNLFNPALYATSFFFPSLGDFLLNAIVFFLIAIAIADRLKSSSENKKFNAVVGVMMATLATFSFIAIIEAFHSLIAHSSLSLNVNNIFTLTFASYIALLIIALILFAFFLVAYRASDFALRMPNPLKVALAAGCCFAIILATFSIQTLGWFLFVSASIVVSRRYLKGSRLTSGVILLMVFSAFASHHIIKNSEKKEIRNRILMAEKLSSEQDPMAEFLFQGIEKRIAADTLLKTMIQLPVKEFTRTSKYITEKHFQGFWNKYNLQFNICDSKDSLIIRPENTQVNCLNYFDTLLNKSVKKGSSNLYFMPNESGISSYIGRLKIDSEEIIIQFTAKFIPEGSGYPELLMGASEVKENPDRLNYSFARYHNDQLVSSSGNFNYSLNIRDWLNSTTGYKIIQEDKFTHLIYKSGTRNGIVLSRERGGYMDALTTFSYLFVCFAFILLVYAFFNTSRDKLKDFWQSLKGKLQVLLVVTIVISLLLFGAGTIFYIQAQYQNKNKKEVSEKLRSILIEMEQKVGAEEKLTPEMIDYISFYLVKFSNVFFTDLNLYDLSGTLIASSRPEIFDLGLLSRKMSPEAYGNIVLREKTEFVHEEKTGELQYLSAYVPLRNNNGKVTAYLNLPHFAKQSDLQNEISFFLVALINIYVLLFILSVIAAILISNYIAAPLNLISNKLRNVSLGKRNEAIQWGGNDEIGGLVKEYNRMIAELEESANRLARSERESAWREMAKQVAHEIKNPLTPIRLSAQHLQRAWNEKSPDFDVRLKRFTDMLEEQIVTLSKIADEFSTFAQMPAPDFEKVNIVEVMHSAAALFKDTSKTDISVNSSAGNTFINADKNHITRIVNNLMKNAIQAIPEGKPGKIEIEIYNKDGGVEFFIRDNGNGIDEEQKSKIFTVNFTTKSSGMGLGLTMVKNMVQLANGKIWFDTKEDEGATFYVWLPAEV